MSSNHFEEIFWHEQYFAMLILKIKWDVNEGVISKEDYNLIFENAEKTPMSLYDSWQSIRNMRLNERFAKWADGKF